jgi:hypothetical protein
MLRSLTLCLSLAVLAPAGLAFADAFGGSGAHFFVARGVEAPLQASVDRCIAHFGPVAAASIAVRGADLFTFQPDRGSGEIVPGTTYGPVGNLTVCYLPPIESSNSAMGVVELVSGGESLTIESQGDCKHVATVVNPGTQLQSCSLTVVGPLPAGVKSGLVTSNGLVARDTPASSVNTHVWTIFLLRN